MPRRRLDLDRPPDVDPGPTHPGLSELPIECSPARLVGACRRAAWPARGIIVGARAVSWQISGIGRSVNACQGSIATWTYLGSISIARQRRLHRRRRWPRVSATLSVVPEPRKGSQTASPGRRWSGSGFPPTTSRSSQAAAWLATSMLAPRLRRLVVFGLVAARSSNGSVQLSFPASGHAAGWSRHRLIERVVIWRSQAGTVEVLLPRVVPEPVLTGLVAPDDRVAHLGGVVAGMLGWRRVATADVTAMRATAKVEPPTAGCQALDAARAARGYRWIDLELVRHRSCLPKCQLLVAQGLSEARPLAADEVIGASAEWIGSCPVGS